jgi:hypothetical protein
MYTDIEKPELIKGLKYWKNPNNQFAVAMLHYTADPDKDPERDGKEWYENERKGTPKATWLKEYEIDFSTKSGKLIFGPEFCDFDPKIHFINSFELPEPYELLMSLDFGQRNPTACLIGAWTMDQRLYIIDEYYKPNLPSKSSKEMFEQFDYLTGYKFKGKTPREKSIIVNNTFPIRVIDPSTTAKNRTKIKQGEEIEYSVIEDFEDHGWEFEPGSNDVANGITRIREYLQLDRDSKPHLYIFKDKCPYLVNEFTKYKYKEYNENMRRQKNESEEPVKKDDHAVDSLRYMIMTRPATPQKPPKELSRIEKDIQNLLKPRIITDDWDSN